jgi:tellurite resistance protein
MTEGAIESVNGGDDDADRKAVEREHAEMQDFAAGLSRDELHSGSWFTKLVVQAVSLYTQKVDWQYLQRKYPGATADIKVDQRIKMATRYAGLAGALFASAYSVAFLKGLGPRGGAGIGPQHGGKVVAAANAAFLAQLQLRMVHDISVLYGVPFYLTDPENMWDLVRTTFVIPPGVVASRVALKKASPFTRRVVKSYYSGPVLKSARELPVIGEHLLQSNVIIASVPLVSVPLVAGVNYTTTLISGQHAQKVCGDKARVIELAGRLSKRTQHPQLLLWVANLVVRADGDTSDAEALLMQYLGQRLREEHQVVVEELDNVINLDPEDVWERVDTASGDLNDVLDAARRIATVDGDINLHEQAVLSELEDRCRRA